MNPSSRAATSPGSQPSMTNKPQDTDTQPWYRQFWPWVIISIPAGTVVAGVITVIIAASGSDSLVVGDYYKEGKAINLQKAAGERAAALGLAALLRFDDEGRQLELVVTGGALPDQLQLKLHHATHADRDRELILQRDNNRYRLELAEPLQRAKWYLRVEPDDSEWRLTGELRYPISRSVRLEPAFD